MTFCAFLKLNLLVLFYPVALPGCGETNVITCQSININVFQALYIQCFSLWLMLLGQIIRKLCNFLSFTNGRVWKNDT